MLKPKMFFITLTFLAALAGCSSNSKKADEDLAAADIQDAQPAQTTDNISLGASSSGRGR